MAASTAVPDSYACRVMPLFGGSPGSLQRTKA